MGYGDWLHWTAILRHLNQYLNEGSEEERLARVKTLPLYHPEEITKSGLVSYRFRDPTRPFKFHLTPSKPKHQHFIDAIMAHNPYLVSGKKELQQYPNLVQLCGYSAPYLVNDQYRDQQHATAQICQDLNLPLCDPRPEMFYSPEEQARVEKYLPKEPFVFIEPTNHKPGRSYPYERFQQIVDRYHSQIKFVQVSPPLKFKRIKSVALKQATFHLGIFSFRETALFLSHARLVIVNHGGLSIAAACSQTPCLAFYNGAFRPTMTQYPGECGVSISDEQHAFCGFRHFIPPYRCEGCEQNYERHLFAPWLQWVGDFLAGNQEAVQSKVQQEEARLQALHP